MADRFGLKGRLGSPGLQGGRGFVQDFFQRGEPLHLVVFVFFQADHDGFRGVQDLEEGFYGFGRAALARGIADGLQKAFGGVEKLVEVPLVHKAAVSFDGVEGSHEGVEALQVAGVIFQGEEQGSGVA
jgi:hypothetical protein